MGLRWEDGWFDPNWKAVREGGCHPDLGGVRMGVVLGVSRGRRRPGEVAGAPLILALEVPTARGLGFVRAARFLLLVLEGRRLVAAHSLAGGLAVRGMPSGQDSAL